MYVNLWRENVVITKYKVFINWKLSDEEIAESKRLGNLEYWRREDIGIAETAEEAKKTLDDYIAENDIDYQKVEYIGKHKYYILTQEEWDKIQHKGTSINDPKVRTWTKKEEYGIALLFEGIHFNIEE